MAGLGAPWREEREMEGKLRIGFCKIRELVDRLQRREKSPPGSRDGVAMPRRASRVLCFGESLECILEPVFAFYAIGPLTGR